MYTINELKQKIKPLAVKYNLSSVYIFGSYARGEATEESDLDFLIDITNSKIKGWLIGELYNDLCEAFNKKIDMLTTYALLSDAPNDKTFFTENVMKERVEIYG